MQMNKEKEVKEKFKDLPPASQKKVLEAIKGAKDGKPVDKS